MTARRARISGGARRWEGVEVMPYKPDSGLSGPQVFRRLSRQVLFDNPDQAAQIRYFDVAPGGRTSLERHAHTHAVVVLDGHGSCLVGEGVFALQPMDLVEVGAWEWHQFRAAGDEHLGFLCVVDRDRDRPQTPSGKDLVRLAATAAVAEFLGLARTDTDAVDPA